MSLMGLPHEMGLVWATALLAGVWSAFLLYITLLPIPGTRSSILIPTCCDEHIDPNLPGMRVKFFYLFGLKLGKRVDFRPPQNKVPHA